MTPAWRWVRADLARRWPAMVALGLLLGVAFGATIALVAGARRAGSATERFTSASDLADVTVFVGGEPTPALAQALADDPRIARVARSDVATIAPVGAQPGSDGFTAVGQDGANAGGLGSPVLLSGRYPAPEASDEILANERAAEQYGLHAGQRTRLATIACMDCRQTELSDEVTITGVVRTAEDLVDDASTTGIFLAPSKFLDGRWQESLRPGSIVWVYLTPGADPVSVSQELSGLVDEGDVSSNATSLSVATRAGDVQRNALLVAAAVVGFMAVLAAGHAMSRFAAGRQSDGAVLAALGMSPRGRGLAAMVLLSPAALGGSFTAGVVALALSPLFPVGLTRRADPAPGVRLDGVVVAGGVFATCLVSAAIVAVVARRWVIGERHSAVRQGSTARALAATGLPPVPSTGVRFAFDRGTGTSRPPTRSTVAAIVMAMVIVTGALVLRSSLDGLGNTEARYGQPWSLAVSPPDDDEHFVNQLEGDERIAAIDRASVGELELTTRSQRHAQAGAIGIEGLGARPALALLEGRQPAGRDEIALGTVTMDDLGVGIGDEITASGPCGARPLLVTGRVIVPAISGDTPDDGSVVSLDAFRELCADELVAEIDRISGLLLTVRDGQVDRVDADLTSAGWYVEQVRRPSAVTSLLDVRGVTLTVAVVVGVLGLAIAAYALVLSVRRRRGELAVLSALGLAPRQVGRIVTTHAAALVLAALAIGVPVGILAGRVLWRAIAEPYNVLVRTDVGMSLVAAGAIVAVAVLAVSWWPSRRARRLDVVEALRSE